MGAAALSASAALLGGAGCSPGDRPATESAAQQSTPQQSAPQPSAPQPMGPQPADPGPLPKPESLAEVLYRLADAAIPGAEKLGLVQGATPADAAALDNFAAALRDAGYTPITVTATDLRWAPGQARDVLATVRITARDDGGEFAFPMDFRRAGAGWQLTRETAEMLLSFGNP